MFSRLIVASLVTLTTLSGCSSDDKKSSDKPAEKKQDENAKPKLAVEDFLQIARSTNGSAMYFVSVKTNPPAKEIKDVLFDGVSVTKAKGMTNAEFDRSIMTNELSAILIKNDADKSGQSKNMIGSPVFSVLNATDEFFYANRDAKVVEIIIVDQDGKDLVLRRKSFS